MLQKAQVSGSSLLLWDVIVNDFLGFARNFEGDGSVLLVDHLFGLSKRALRLLRELVQVHVEARSAEIVVHLLGDDLGWWSRALLDSLYWGIVETGFDSDDSVLAIIMNRVEVGFQDLDRSQLVQDTLVDSFEILRSLDLFLVMRHLSDESSSTLDLLLVDLLSSGSSSGLLAQK